VGSCGEAVFLCCMLCVCKNVCFYYYRMEGRAVQLPAGVLNSRRFYRPATVVNNIMMSYEAHYYDLVMSVSVQEGRPLCVGGAARFRY
jgi:hypothetical protein